MILPHESQFGECGKMSKRLIVALIRRFARVRILHRKESLFGDSDSSLFAAQIRNLVQNWPQFR